jgi:hypothetical protein
MSEHQISIVSLDQLVSEHQQYSKFKKLFDFKSIESDLIAAAVKRIHLCAVKKNNMKAKNFDLYRYYTKIMSPFERVFSKDNKRLRYRSSKESICGIYECDML